MQYIAARVLTSQLPGLFHWHLGCRAGHVPGLPDLRSRTHRFAIDSIAFVRRLPNTSEAHVVGLQYLRSATGVNSNYRAARRGRSRKEFIAKLGNVVEEADESVEWLEMMRESSIAHDP